MGSIILTGGTGFIGSHTCISLLELGYKVILIDSFINSYEIIKANLINLAKYKNIDPNNLSFFNIDINDKKALEKIFLDQRNQGNPIDTVFHFAGLKSVSDSFLNFNEYWRVNVCGTFNIVELMLKYDCFNMIFSSSASVYNYQNKTNFKESDSTNPISPYGKTKLTIEQYLKDAFNAYPSKLRIACMRYFNPVGSHNSYLIGELPKSNKNNIFPNLCKISFGEIDKLNIFGRDWNTRDGFCVRDYIHIMDIARGHIDVFKYLINRDPEFIILNLGSGKGVSVLEVINAFQEINNCKIPYQIKKRRMGDVDSLVADNSYAYNLLGWKPKYSLRDMCFDSYNWYKKIKNLY